ncbi:MAG: hypothetical protein MI920_09055 [Kiloniellales bacterium]|nr:hypothetical protein [Kiloniellales bacterium]
MKLETLAYVLLGLGVAVWALILLTGLIAIFPFGLIGLLVIAGLGLLFIKVLRERLANKEDDHYAKNVEK